MCAYACVMIKIISNVCNKTICRQIYIYYITKYIVNNRLVMKRFIGDTKRLHLQREIILYRLF